MGAVVLGEVPDADAAPAVAADDLALVGVDDDVVGRAAVAVAALDGARARLPDLDGAILARRHHPLALAVEGDAGDVARVALERQQRVRVCRLDVEQLHRVVARRREEPLIRRDTQPVHLRIRVLDRPGTYPRQCLPEPDRVVVARCNRSKGWGGMAPVSQSVQSIESDTRNVLCMLLVLAFSYCPFLAAKWK